PCTGSSRMRRRSRKSWPACDARSKTRERYDQRRNEMAVAKVEGGADKSAVKSTGKDKSEGEASAMPEPETNRLSEPGEKIFLDRYALKDVAKETLSEGDTVVVCVD